MAQEREYKEGNNIQENKEKTAWKDINWSDLDSDVPIDLTKGGRPDVEGTGNIGSVGTSNRREPADSSSDAGDQLRGGVGAGVSENLED